MVKNLPATAGVSRAAGLIPGSGRSPIGGNGNPLQYSWLSTHAPIVVLQCCIGLCYTMKWISCIIRIYGEGSGNPLQYWCLENPMEKEPGGLQSMGSQKSRTRLSDWTAIHISPPSWTSLPLPYPIHLGYHRSPRWTPCAIILQVPNR